MKKIFTVILNWNRAKDTIECLGSVSRLSIADCQLSIVVVDNASSDSSVKEIKEFAVDSFKFHILVNKANLGFAGGNNVGIKFALKNGADYVLVLNNDTRVDKNLLIKLLGAFEKQPNIGVASPKIYFEKGYEFHKDRYKKENLGKVIWYAGGVIDWKNIYGSNRGVDEIDEGQYEREIETDFATGTCSFFSANALRNIGLYDEKYFMYFEDTDLSMRMKKEGYKVVYVPKGVVWHKVAQSSGIGSNLNDYYISRNRMLFGMKYASLITKVALIKESAKFLISGRKWQKTGVRDYYLRNFGKGSWLS